MLLFTFCAFFCRVQNFGLQFMKYIYHHIPPTTKTLIAYKIRQMLSYLLAWDFFFFFFEGKKGPRAFADQFGRRRILTRKRLEKILYTDCVIQCNTASCPLLPSAGISPRRRNPEEALQ